MILQKVREGEALGPVMSRYTGIDEIGRKEGAIGVYCRETHSRQRLSPGGDPRQSVSQCRVSGIVGRIRRSRRIRHSVHDA